MTAQRIILVGLISFAMWGCKKSFPDQTPEQLALQEDTYAATAILSVEGLLNEMEFIVRQAPLQEKTESFLSCANISKQDIPEGYVIEITFESKSLCSDSRYRSGKLRLTYNTITGNVLLQPINYIIKETLITGSYSFLNITENQKNKTQIVVSNGKLSLYDGSFIKFNANRKTSLQSAGLTHGINDDIIQIEKASCDLELDNNTRIEAENRSPLILKYDCDDKFRPRAGTIWLERASGAPRIIDFGTGNCSDRPTLL